MRKLIVLLTSAPNSPPIGGDHWVHLPSPVAALHCRAPVSRNSTVVMSQMRRTMFLPGPRGGPILAPSSLRSVGRIGCEVQHKHQALLEHIRLPFRLFRRQILAVLSYLELVSSQPVFLYTLCWTLLLAAVVTITALSLEVGFSSSLSPSMEVVQQCSKDINKATIACQQCSRLPLDGPNDYLCVPASLFQKTRMDFAVPPIFAGLVVAASALFVQGMSLWNY